MTNRPALSITAYGETMDITPNFSAYANGRIAVRFDCEDGPFATLTVNLPDQHLNEGEVFVKDWSENEAMVAALLDAGWLTPTGREVISGYVVPKVMILAGDLLAAARYQDAR